MTTYLCNDAIYFATTLFAVSAMRSSIRFANEL
jgi:hypothetical protein